LLVASWLLILFTVLEACGVVWKRVSEFSKKKKKKKKKNMDDKITQFVELTKVDRATAAEWLRRYHNNLGDAVDAFFEAQQQRQVVVEEPGDFYAVLGVAKNCSQAEIRKAYLVEAKKCHPDRNRDENSTRRFQELANAYATLSDPNLRQQYDASLGKRSVATPVQEPQDFFANFRRQFFQDFPDDEDVHQDPFGGFFRNDVARRDPFAGFGRRDMFASDPFAGFGSGSRSVSTRVMYRNGQKITTITTVDETGRKTVEERVE
jgi:hypothetical protein